MDTALLLARLILAAVFAVSGVAKLVDVAGSRRALEGFGVPARLAVPGGVLLPVAELAIAVLLLPVATAWWAGLAALLLLLAFVAGIGYNLARGRAPDCHCFGQLHSEPIGWQTLARDGVLAAVAAFLVVFGWDDPGPGLVGWVGDLSTGEAVALVLGGLALVAVAVEGWLLVHLLRQNGRLLPRVEELEARLDGQGGAASTAAQPAGQAAGLPEGAPAPEFALGGLHGETVTLASLRAGGKPVLLVFSDPGCGPCTTLMPDLGRWQQDLAAHLTIAVIGRGTVEANKTKSAEHGVSRVLLQQGFEVAQAYRAIGTPSAVLIRADGAIGSPVAAGVEAIRAIVARAARTPIPPETAARVPAVQATRSTGVNGAVDPVPPAVPPPAGAEASAEPAPPGVGDPAPVIALPDLDGETVGLDRFRGTSTLVLFWSPSCGYCQRMIEDLKTWENAPPADAPALIVVSSGDPDANRALGVRAPVLLDRGFATGRAFGASGTPSAVLVDPDGKIGSPLAVGAANVLALVGYVSAGCEQCLEDCQQQGGGDACRTVCEMGGQCA